MKKHNLNNSISDEATLERSFSYCTESLKTIFLQIRRLKSTEPEDSTFVFRQWADLRFLILSLDRLSKAASIATNVDEISSKVKQIQKEFTDSIPYLKKLRDIGEHFDAYSMDDGKLKDMSRKSLQVGTWSEDGLNFTWLDEEIDVMKCQESAIKLYESMQEIKNDFFKKKKTD